MNTFLYVLLLEWSFLQQSEGTKVENDKGRYTIVSQAMSPRLNL